MRSTAFLTTALALLTSSCSLARAQFAYDDYSEDFDLAARDAQYGSGYDMDDFLELYSREAAELDFDNEMFDFDARDASMSTQAGSKGSAMVIDDFICVVNKKIEWGSKCTKGKDKFIGTVKINAATPPGFKLDIAITGGEK